MATHAPASFYHLSVDVSHLTTDARNSVDRQDDVALAKTCTASALGKRAHKWVVVFWGNWVDAARKNVRKKE
jgi:hypothetical protein